MHGRVHTRVEWRVGREHWDVDRCIVVEALGPMSRMHHRMVHCVHVKCELSCMYV